MAREVMTKSSLLTSAAVAVLLVYSPSFADENPTYACRWYLIRQCGTGHPGGVEFVQEDDRGDLWTTAGNCWSSSLWRFDREQWQQRYKVGRKGSSLYSAAYRKNDGLYVATEQGLVHVVDDRLTLHTEMFIVHDFGPSRFHYRTNVHFNAVPTKLVYVDKRDDLWAYAPNIGLFRHTGGIWSESTAYWPRDDNSRKLIDLVDGAEVSSIHAVNKDVIVVGTSDGSVYLLAEKAGSHGGDGVDVALSAKYTAKEIGIPEGAEITSMASDARGRLWIAYGKGDADGGVARLCENEWTLFHHANSGLPKRPVTAIAVLPGERIMAGVDWRDPTVGGAPEGVSYDKPGLLEFASGKWRFLDVDGFSERAGRVTDNGPGEPKETALYNESYRRITCITPDSRGNIWVGTQAGLACLTPVKERQTIEEEPSTASGGDEKTAAP